MYPDQYGEDDKEKETEEKEEEAKEDEEKQPDESAEDAHKEDTAAPEKKEETPAVDSTELLLDVVCNVLAVIRRTKTEAKVSQRAEVEHVLVTATDAQISLLQLGLVDLLNAGVAQKVEFIPQADEHISTTVRLLAQ
jgi:hypothetical protein